MAAVSVKRSIFLSAWIIFFIVLQIFFHYVLLPNMDILFLEFYFQSVTQKTTTKRVVEINSTQKDLHINISISLQYFFISLFNNILIFKVYITI